MKRGHTYSFSSLVQYPIKLGIFPDKLFPSILLQEEYRFQKHLT